MGFMKMQCEVECFKFYQLSDRKKTCENQRKFCKKPLLEKLQLFCFLIFERVHQTNNKAFPINLRAVRSFSLRSFGVIESF